ncbi:Cell division protein ZapA, inhibits GTPase activity of FtsZ [Alkalispirochaeta americana]|uniref:Cell division protein ZapA, inhibits GTPase activity of FtsZ n=2 Tax=Alkalispirochaeta americana TaxID=159291 RepID=A0A1N6WF60_9SPIO|nr:Cell division protein ZapA, inhibits GTPase activity of FtsZ [Alkalispirochaeta americana]
MMRIDLLGTSFQIQSDEEPEYLEEILSYYRDRLQEIEETVATRDPLKKSILAALVVTDELFRSRSEGASSEDVGEIEEIAHRLLQSIDEILPEPSP